MSSQQLQMVLDNLQSQKQALEQDINERPWTGISFDPREAAWNQLQNKSIDIHNKLIYARHKEHQMGYLRQLLADLNKSIDALEKEIQNYPWGDPRRKEWLAEYEEQRQMAAADYALLQGDTY